MGAGFLNCNRNKRSLAVDLKSPEGREILHALLRRASVLVHNMRPGSATRLGIGYEDLRRVNEQLVYCRSAGFGEGGPNAEAPAYDDIIQAMSGLAHMNAGSQGEPRFLPTIVCDKVGGLHLALAVLGGVVHRLVTGKGCAVEAPMYESMVSFLMAEQLGGETFVPPLGRTGYERLLSPNRRPFRTRDGYVGILPYSTTHWTRFFDLVGWPESVPRDHVTDPVKRSENVDALYAAVARVTPARSTEEWLAELGARDIPCSRVNRLDDLFADPHLAAVGFFGEVRHPTEGTLRSVREPFAATGVDVEPDRPVPLLGQDTRELLEEAGFDAARIADLEARGIVRVGE
jgi:crotonobetainyl-CoA:carnitine CoA-transferase CaiB-like acyl-CoA transferase